MIKNVLLISCLCLLAAACTKERNLRYGAPTIIDESMKLKGSPSPSPLAPSPAPSASPTTSPIPSPSPVIINAINGQVIDEEKVDDKVKDVVISKGIINRIFVGEAKDKLAKIIFAFNAEGALSVNISTMGKEFSSKEPITYNLNWDSDIQFQPKGKSLITGKGLIVFDFDLTAADGTKLHFEDVDKKGTKVSSQFVAILSPQFDRVVQIQSPRSILTVQKFGAVKISTVSLLTPVTQLPNQGTSSPAIQGPSPLPLLPK